MTAMEPQFIADMAGRLSDDEAIRLAMALLALEKEEKRTQFRDLFPDDGPLRRDLYPRHLEFFRVGADFRSRLFMAGNRVGKTISGSYELTCHLTGQYPHWWEGRRFDTAIDAWVAGDTNETTRDILQKALLGEVAYEGARKTLDGTGIVPFDTINPPRWKTGVPDLVDYIEINHVSGGRSKLGFKSYDQGRRVFQGTEKHVVWLDEECPEDVYGECLIRTATTGGIVMMTFTPLRGMSALVRSFLQPEDKGKER